MGNLVAEIEIAQRDKREVLQIRKTTYERRLSGVYYSEKLIPTSKHLGYIIDEISSLHTEGYDVEWKVYKPINNK